MKQYLLIDIGGTFIKYSLADEQARKISGGKVPTPLTNMDDLLAVIEGFAAPLQGQFVGCAISMPGRIDTRNGIAHTGGMLSTFMWEQPFAAQVTFSTESMRASASATTILFSLMYIMRVKVREITGVMMI